MNIKTPGEGYILVEIPKEIDSIKTQSGFELMVDTSFNTGQYANIHATVLAVCDKLHSKSSKANKGKKGHFSPDEDVRLQVGDEVYFGYLTLTNAKKNYERGRYWEEGGKRYALLPYASCHFAVRKTVKSTTENKDIFVEPKPLVNLTEVKTGIPTKSNEPDKVEVKEYIMLNRWLLIEPITKAQHSETFDKYGTVIIDDEKSTGKIAVIAENPFKSSEGIVAACPPDLGLKIGDNVIFQKESDVPVEFSLCQTLDKPYWRMLFQDIVAKRNGRGIDLIDNYCLVIRDNPEKRSEFNIWPQDKLTGTVVKTGPQVKGLKVGDHVFFNDEPYVDFPWNDKFGLLIREGSIFLFTKGQKIERV